MTLQVHGQKSEKPSRIKLSLINKLENVVAKGNIAQIEQYFLFATMFSKDDW